ncbi:hypothetical protein LTR67_001967 [Exophiala xenobiotica]
MASKWTKETEQKLLFAVMTPADIKPDWGSISKAMGPDFTGESCRQKFYKLKKEAEKILGTDGPGTATTPKTPTAKADKTTPRKSTGGGKRKKADSVDDVEETPTKKKKANVKVEVKSEPDANDTKQAKVEDVEDDESGL